MADCRSLSRPGLVSSDEVHGASQSKISSDISSLPSSADTWRPNSTDKQASPVSSSSASAHEADAASSSFRCAVHGEGTNGQSRDMMMSGLSISGLAPAPSFLHLFFNFGFYFDGCSRYLLTAFDIGPG